MKSVSMVEKEKKVASFNRLCVGGGLKNSRYGNVQKTYTKKLFRPFARKINGDVSSKIRY